MTGTEILMNVTPQESRVALVDNGVLTELHLERARRRGIVGNIYKGRVVRVLPGMDAAFVDIGLDRTAFLHASDVAPVEREELNGPGVGNGAGNGAGNGGGNGSGRAETIRELLREGQDVLVQVIKDPLGTKAPG